MRKAPAPGPLPPRRKPAVVAALMARLPGRFSVELGLALERRHPQELLLWFLATLLYGARISGSIAVRTYSEFVRRGIVTPERILKTGWDGLVEGTDLGATTVLAEKRPAGGNPSVTSSRHWSDWAGTTAVVSEGSIARCASIAVGPGSNALMEDKRLPSLSPSWLQAIEAVADDPGVIMVIGASDSGKTTWLAAAALQDLPCHALSFVGSVSPVGHLLQSLVATKRLVDKALRSGARTVLVDTTGLIPQGAGFQLKLGKTALLAPQHAPPLAQHAAGGRSRGRSGLAE